MAPRLTATAFLLAASSWAALGAPAQADERRKRIVASVGAFAEIPWVASVSAGPGLAIGSRPGDSGVFVEGDADALGLARVAGSASPTASLRGGRAAFGDAAVGETIDGADAELKVAPGVKLIAGRRTVGGQLRVGLPLPSGPGWVRVGGQLSASITHPAVTPLARLVSAAGKVARLPRDLAAGAVRASVRAVRQPAK